MDVQELWTLLPGLWEQEEHYWKFQRESHEVRTFLKKIFYISHLPSFHKESVFMSSLFCEPL